MYPARVELSGSPIDKRVETAVNGTQSLGATLTYAGALPTKAQVTAAGETSTFAYDLKPRTAPFEAWTWTIDEAKNAVAEEIDLRAPNVYSGAGDAGDLLNGGVALWRGAGDFIGAQQRFVAAAGVAPEATAPRLATFEMALDARDFGAAQVALDALAPLGLDIAELEARRARLALAMRDWDGALVALDKAIAAAPESSALQLGRAQALLGRGDVAGARAVWGQLLAVPAARATAAALLRSDADLDAALKAAAFSALVNRAALPPGGAEENRRYALLLESASKDKEATTLWSELEKIRAPTRLKTRRRAHLMTLFARDGDTAASLASLRAVARGFGAAKRARKGDAGVVRCVAKSAQARPIGRGDFQSRRRHARD